MRQLEEMWLDLFLYAVELTAVNIEYISTKYQAELMQVDKDVI